MAFVKTIAHFLVFSARFCDKAQAELARSKARAMDPGFLTLTRAGALGYCSLQGGPHADTHKTVAFIAVS